MLQFFQKQHTLKINTLESNKLNIKDNILLQKDITSDELLIAPGVME